jgi:hypothetical protein
MRGRPNRTPKLRAAFLGALAETGGNVTAACKKAKLPRATAYEWRDEDEAFRKDWDAALEIGTDALEDEALRRARDGVKKPIYQQGKRVGYVQEYSDTLLIFMLKARRPDKFRERIQHSGDPNSPISVRINLA